MRDIRFKGKSINSEGNKWVYGYLIKAIASDNYYIIEDLFESPFINRLDEVFGYIVVPESIGQYTGLKDINGEEIYENDIVKFPKDEDGTRRIVFNEQMGGFAIFRESTGYSLLSAYAEGLEVISNITDNPEWKGE